MFTCNASQTGGNFLNIFGENIREEFFGGFLLVGFVTKHKVGDVGVKKNDLGQSDLFYIWANFDQSWLSVVKIEI